MIHLNVSKSPDEATRAQQGKAALHHVADSHTWRTYYVKLLVLAQARRWLSATERLDPIADAPSTPKTNFQLADAIKHPEKAKYVPFGNDFEDADAYGPVISRLLLYAEIHNYSDHGYGTFSAPTEMAPYTYRQLQQFIIERRRMQQRSDDGASSSRELVGTAEDLAAKLSAFASEGVVVKHIIEFALPPKKRANAAEVTATGASAASGPATEHTRSTATEHTTQPGDAPRSAATEPASEPKKRLRTNHKDAYDVTLSQDTAQAMADSFFKFVVQEHLQQHLSRRGRKASLWNCTIVITIGYRSHHTLQLHK